jgi:hypothetical protein
VIVVEPPVPFVPLRSFSQGSGEEEATTAAVVVVVVVTTQGQQMSNEDDNHDEGRRPLCHPSWRGALRRSSSL